MPQALARCVKTTTLPANIEETSGYRRAEFRSLRIRRIWQTQSPGSAPTGPSTAAHADAAVRDLEAADIPTSAISRQPSATEGVSTSEQPREPGFWSSLFGGEPDHDTNVYDRSIEGGSHLITVRVPEQQVASVTSILERHYPIDIDERASGYGLGAAGTTTTDMRGSIGTTAGLGARNSAMRGDEEKLELAEEQLTVGRRLVNRGTTRIRRFVVETPVEENVTLHSERISVDRRPVTGDARVSDVDFTDKTIEMTETDEEAVVGKTARVKEEVVVHKNAGERVETVRDTVRREDVEITKDGSVEPGAARTGPVPPASR